MLRLLGNYLNTTEAKSHIEAEKPIYINSLQKLCEVAKQEPDANLDKIIQNLPMGILLRLKEEFITSRPSYTGAFEIYTKIKACLGNLTSTGKFKHLCDEMIYTIKEIKPFIAAERFDKFQSHEQSKNTEILANIQNFLTKYIKLDSSKLTEDFYKYLCSESRQILEYTLQRYIHHDGATLPNKKKIFFEMSHSLLAACIESYCVYNPVEAGKILSQAAEAKTWLVVEMACCYGADVNQTTLHDQFPLYYALFSCNDKLINYLLSYGARYEKGYFHLYFSSNPLSTPEYNSKFPPVIAYLCGLNNRMIDETGIATIYRLLQLHPKGIEAAIDETITVVDYLTKQPAWKLPYGQFPDFDKINLAALKSSLDAIIPRIRANKALAIINNEEKFNAKTDKDDIKKYLLQCVADAKSVLAVYHLYTVHHDKDYLKKRLPGGYSKRKIEFINALRKKGWELIKDANKESNVLAIAAQHPLFSNIHHKQGVNIEYYDSLNKRIKALATAGSDQQPIYNLYPPAYAQPANVAEPTAPDFDLLPKEPELQPQRFFTAKKGGNGELGGISLPCVII